MSSNKKKEKEEEKKNEKNSNTEIKKNSGKDIPKKKKFGFFSFLFSSDPELKVKENPGSGVSERDRHSAEIKPLVSPEAKRVRSSSLSRSKSKDSPKPVDPKSPKQVTKSNSKSFSPPPLTKTPSKQVTKNQWQSHSSERFDEESNMILVGIKQELGKQIKYLHEVQRKQSESSIQSSVHKDFQNLLKSDDLNPHKSITRPIPELHEWNNKPTSVLDFSASDLKEMKEDVTSQVAIKKLILFENQIQTIPASINQMILLEVLDLGYNKIKEISQYVCELSNLKELILTCNEITTISPLISGLTTLNKLNLASNYLKSIPLEILTIPNLTILDLGRNQITELPALQQNSFKNITTLNLRDNKLKDISPILQLVGLKFLNLRENDIEILPENFGDLSQLVELFLALNHIQSLPLSFKNLKQLTKLDMSGNNISSLSQNLFSDPPSFENLKELNLRENNLIELPDSFWNLTALTILNIMENKLKHVSPAVKNLTQLKQLLLGCNHLVSIPEEIGVLTNLEFLNLASNQLTQIPVSILKLPNLISLLLAYNKLKEIPDSIQLGNLTEFFLNGNELTSLPSSFSTLTQLQQLYLAANKLSTLEGNLFEQLTGLQRFDCSYNQLTILHSCLNNLVELETLDLSFNQIQTIENNFTIDRWNFLQEFNLSGNQLTSIPEDDFRYLLNRGVNIYLEFNPVQFIQSSQHLPFIRSPRFEEYFSSMSGKRPTMEDAFIIQGKLGENDNQVEFYGLFDGHAGDLAAHYCADIFPQVFSRLLEQNSFNISIALKQSFPEVNKQLEEYVHDKEVTLRNCGTTVVIVVISKNKLYVGNLGDTRAVLGRAGKAIRLSQDHKPSIEEERIKSLGGYIMGDFTQRVNGMVAVSRCLGDFFMHPFIIDTPYIFELDLTSQDEFVILACDGVWDELSDQKAVDRVREINNRNLSATKLRDLAYILESDDNISVLVVWFNFKEKETEIQVSKQGKEELNETKEQLKEIKKEEKEETEELKIELNQEQLQETKEQTNKEEERKEEKKELKEEIKEELQEQIQNEEEQEEEQKMRSDQNQVETRELEQEN